MQSTQVFGVLRTVLAAFFGYLAGQGVVDGATGEALAGAVATIIIAVWSVMSKPKAGEVAE